MQKVVGTMRRVNTAASIFKQLLSKSESRHETDGITLGTFESSASIAGKPPENVDNIEIADQVSEDDDEQTPMTVIRNEDDKRPTVQGIFFEKHDPVDVPGLMPPPSYSRFVSDKVHGEDSSLFPPGGVDDLLSASAPASIKMSTSTSQLPDTKTSFDPTQHGSQQSRQSSTVESDSTSLAGEDFEKLRQERETARTARQMEKMAASIASQQSMVNQIELKERLGDALIKQPELASGNSSSTSNA